MVPAKDGIISFLSSFGTISITIAYYWTFRKLFVDMLKLYHPIPAPLLKRRFGIGLLGSTLLLALYVYPCALGTLFDPQPGYSEIEYQKAKKECLEADPNSLTVLERRLQEVTRNEESFFGPKEEKLISLTNNFMAPVAEEVLFRGMVFNNFLPLSKVIAHLFSATTFGFNHSADSNMFATLIGLYLSYLYYCSGNLIYPIALHSALNTMTMSLTNYTARVLAEKEPDRDILDTLIEKKWIRSFSYPYFRLYFSRTMMSMRRNFSDSDSQYLDSEGLLTPEFLKNLELLFFSYTDTETMDRNTLWKLLVGENPKTPFKSKSEHSFELFSHIWQKSYFPSGELDFSTFVIMMRDLAHNEQRIVNHIFKSNSHIIEEED
eukprot:TRINITY_DN5291_c0_g1_i1.p1 TRINITY_DN5291_c0_g1~~TRINITY_DN5291_c0_g1_i1.p1  ORF type:complete len:377 (-),score=47.07 TRINITY_DN5291_c0_g1_i1:679-1809(-)